MHDAGRDHKLVASSSYGRTEEVANSPSTAYRMIKTYWTLLSQNIFICWSVSRVYSLASSALPIIIAKYRRLLERCTGIAEAKGSIPVQACFFFLFMFFFVRLSFRNRKI